MPLIVKKFGGTSVGSIELIQKIARNIKIEKEKNNDIVVVLSAMSGSTDNLIAMANSITDTPNPREYDALISTGEQVSVALLAIALHSMGCDCKSYTGNQISINTDSAFGKARIAHISSEKIRKDIKQGKVVIVAGFQGVDSNGDTTTLGRGGSDTTAVALAAGLQAAECQIYTDVKGIYTCDPRVVKKARKIDQITCEEMMELAGAGAKVLQIRSVIFANKYQVPLRVLSSLDSSDKQGTFINFEKANKMEKTLISCISFDKNEAQITIGGISDTPGIAAQIIGIISSNNIVIDMIVQNSSKDNKTDITFTLNKSDYRQALKLMEQKGEELNASFVSGNDKIAKLSVVGAGMRSNAGAADTMFSALAEQKINILMISTSEIKISVIIEEDVLDLAAELLHKVFELDYESSD